jgi:hypothetical protein
MDDGRQPSGSDPRDDVIVRVRNEHWPFRCDSCGSRWTAHYEVRDYVGPSGEELVVHCRHGDVVPAPHFGDRCPSCGRISVTIDGAASNTDGSRRLDAETAWAG